MLICANKEGNGPASADQGRSTASQGSHHVHDMSIICLPTSPYPTFYGNSKTYLQNDGLRQLIIYGQSLTTPKGVIGS